MNQIEFKSTRQQKNLLSIFLSLFFLLLFLRNDGKLLAQEGFLNEHFESFINQTNDIFITIDDCNDFEYLVSMTQTLDSVGAQGTFFPNTNYLNLDNEEKAAFWRELIQNGHTVGYHTTDHSNEWDWHGQSLEESVEILTNDFLRFQQVFRDLTGDSNFRILYARPPYGDNDEAWMEFIRRNNLINVMWDVTSSGQSEYILHILSDRGPIFLSHTRAYDSRLLTELIHEFYSIANSRDGSLAALNSFEDYLAMAAPELLASLSPNLNES